MGVGSLAVAVLLALPVVTLCYTDQWLHQIYVDNQTQYGVDDPSCWTGGYSTPCRSLNLALTGAQHYNHSTAIFLQPGQHQLHGGGETQLKDMSQLAIVGNNSKGEVVVICEPLAGLAFSWSKNIEIKNIEFAGCGVQINTSNCMNVPPTQYATSLEIQIALYFSSCEGIYLMNVCVYKSAGTGVAIYNPVGVANIDKCQFIRNGLTLSELGGGGLVIEANERTSGSFCTISDTSFTQNTASSGHYLFIPDAYFGPGKGGGGILIVFRGGTVNNTVQLENVTLERNIAQFGGSIFLGFYESASSNIININNGQVTQNKALLESRDFLSSAKGGGAFIGLVSSESEGVFNNTVAINNTRFDSNEAQMGGGISVHVFYDTHGCSSTGGNKLLISNCIFSNNEAFQGASAYLSQSGDGILGSQALEVTVHHSSFTGGQCIVSLQLIMMNGFGLPCRGDVLMVSFTLTLEGDVMFNGTQNLSALDLQYSSLKLLPFTKLEFHNNSAENGAALYLVDCSSILVNYNTSLLFQNNYASNRGGAIYAETCKLQDQANGKGCFIRHVNSTLHPNQWETKIGFNENKAFDEGNSIYVDSTKPCTWTDSSSNINKDTFCWSGWSFENRSNCDRNQLASGPVSITGPTSYTVQPGDCFSLLDYELHDGWNNTIQSDLKVLFCLVLFR